MEKTPEGNIQRLSQDQRHAYGFTGWSLETTKQNMAPNWIDSDLQKNPDFFVTFGVFFTAVTGIVAGANLSGDLKVKRNPDVFSHSPLSFDVLGSVLSHTKGNLAVDNPHLHLLRILRSADWLCLQQPSQWDSRGVQIIPEQVDTRY